MNPLFETPCWGSIVWPAAEQLADNISILGDVQFVIDACDHLGRLLTSTPAGESSESVLLRALWDSALVAYVRCYVGGVRSTRSKENA